MSSWHNVSVNDLGQVITGYTPPVKNTEYFGNEYPFITPTDMTVDSRIVQTDRFLSQTGYEYRRNRLLPPNAICVTCVGSLGKMCMTSVPSATNQQINSVVVDQDRHDSYFVYYLLRTKTAVIKSVAGGVATPIVKKSTFASLVVSVPSLATQHKIAAILSNYDDLIENNTRRIKILEAMASTIYREWFVEFRFPGHEKVKMVESELGLIPQGWEIVTLSDIVELTRKGLTPSKFPKETFAHYSIPAFDNGGFPTLDAGNTIKSSKYVVPPDCVLMSKLNPQIPRVWLPFINTVHRPIASTEFLIIKPKSGVDCVYLFHLFQSLEFSREFSVQRLGTSRSHQRVSPAGFLGMSILLPNESLLNEFRAKVSPIVDLCNVLRLKNTNLRKTRDLLLPKLISGELDVSDLDINIDGIQPRKGGTHIPHPLTEWLHSDEKILAGKPVIKGTRLAVEFIVDLLEHDWNEDKILENYPGITREEIEACRAYQKKVLNASASG